MTWLSIILWIITNIPSLINIIKEIIKLIHGGQMSLAKQHSLRIAISEAIHSQDMAKLEAILKSALTS